MKQMTAAELRTWREAHGWTQNEAARMLGTTQESISRWETEKVKEGRSMARPIPPTIAILANLLTFEANIPRVKNFRDPTP